MYVDCTIFCSCRYSLLFVRDVDDLLDVFLIYHARHRPSYLSGGSSSYHVVLTANDLLLLLLALTYIQLQTLNDVQDSVLLVNLDVGRLWLGGKKGLLVLLLVGFLVLGHVGRVGEGF